jgi:zinc protease
MKIYIMMLAMLILAAFHSEKQEQGSSGKIFPYPIHSRIFPNDLNLVTVPYESPGIVSFYIIVRAGSREEVEPGKTGFAHFFEHMMFRGTEKYPSEKYDATMKSIGAGANANTWLDRTIYHMTGNAEMLDKMFEIESDRFFNLKYSVHDFKTEAGAVKGEYTKNFASPFMQLSEKTMATAFQEHTYQHTTMGFWEDVVDMPNQYEYSLEFFDRFYKPEYTTILVVGDVTHEKAEELTEKYFGDWKKGNYIPQIPVEPEQTETRFAHVQNGNFPPYISLNYKTPAFDPEIKDNAALQVISEILFSQKSELYKKLVIDEAIARNLGSNYLFTRDPYLFTVSATLKNAEDLQYAKDQITTSIQELISTGINEKVLEDTKSHIRYSFASSLNSASSIAQSLSYMIWVSGNPDALNRYYQQVEELTVADLQETAEKYLIPGRLTISTISPATEGGVS